MARKPMKAKGRGKKHWEIERSWHVLEGAGVNCMLRWIRPTIGPASEKSEALLYLSAEALAKKEKLDLRLWNETPNSVMIEGRMKPMSYMREGKRYISIDGLEFRVLDIILKNELMAYNIHVNWKNLDEEHQLPIGKDGLEEIIETAKEKKYKKMKKGI